MKHLKYFFIFLFCFLVWQKIAHATNVMFFEDDNIVLSSDWESHFTYRCLSDPVAAARWPWGNNRLNVVDLSRVISDELFGRDMVLQINEEGLSSLAKAYIANRFGDFRILNEGTDIGLVHFQLQVWFNDVDVEIISDELIQLTFSLLVQLTGQSPEQTIYVPGSTVMNTGLLLQRDENGFPLKLVADTGNIDDLQINLQEGNQFLPFDTDELKARLDERMPAILPFIQLPLTEPLRFLTDFVDRHLHAPPESVVLKLVPHLRPNQPAFPRPGGNQHSFVMIGMNIVSGPASDLDDVYFNQFNNDLVRQEQPTSFVIALTPGTYRTLVSNHLDRIMARLRSHGLNTLEFQYPNHSDFFSGPLSIEQCPVQATCFVNAVVDGQDFNEWCTLNPDHSFLLLNSFYGDGRAQNHDFHLLAQMNPEVRIENQIHKLYFNVNVYEFHTDLSWWENIAVDLGLADIPTAQDIDNQFGDSYLFKLEQPFDQFNAYLYNVERRLGSVSFFGRIDSDLTVDSDDDGIIDIAETGLLGTDPNNADSDGDGINDYREVFEIGSNPLADDSDLDGVADGQELDRNLNPLKSDNPAIVQIILNYLLDADSDGDGLDDAQDNCPHVQNANQADRDRDGIGDVCDPDKDNDGIANENDNCPSTMNADQRDRDGNGIGNACDWAQAINQYLQTMRERVRNDWDRFWRNWRNRFQPRWRFN